MWDALNLVRHIDLLQVRHLWPADCCVVDSVFVTDACEGDVSLSSLKPFFSSYYFLSRKKKHFVLCLKTRRMSVHLCLFSLEPFALNSYPSSTPVAPLIFLLTPNCYGVSPLLVPPHLSSAWNSMRLRETDAARHAAAPAVRKSWTDRETSTTWQTS